jgi:Ser/Thr protein kinase RdoA (MazF antagonist)
VFPAVLASEPDAVEREAAVLEWLTSRSKPAPRLVAADPSATSCDVPALLMTRLPGRPRTRPRDLGSFVDALAAPLHTIHTIPLPPPGAVPDYRPYSASLLQGPPSWSRHPRAWERAIERRAAGPPAFEPVFIHRDYHALNVLWSAGRVSGIVDWAWACRGPAAVDFAHCRCNLVLGLGPDAAEAFLRAATDCTAYDPAWDLLDAVDFLPDLHDSRAALRRLDEFVARAVAAAGIST